MGSITDFLENELLDHVLEVGAYSPPANLYLALCTADPTDAATGSSISEPSGNGYARKAITFNAAASRNVQQASLITFDQATGPWGTITHYAICDALTNGNCLAHGSLSTAKQVVSGNTPSVATNEVQISFTAGEVSNYLANALLDFAFRNQAFSQPNINVALCTADVTDSDTGSTITEPSGNGYARKDFNTWNAASGGASANNGDITFATPTGSWGTITAVALLDAASAGNLLMYDNGITEQAPNTDDTVKFPSGDLDITLD